MSYNRELTRQLMLAFRREHGRRELEITLAENALPSSFANIKPDHEAGIIGALSGKVTSANLAHAKRLAFAADNGDGDDEGDVMIPTGEIDAECDTITPLAASAPRDFGSLVEPSYRKWNEPKKRN